MVKPWIKPVRYYRIFLKNTSKITLPPVITQLQELGEAVECEIVRQRLSQVQADYAAHKSIVFTSLCLNQRGMSNSDESLPWQAVKRISIGTEELIIEERERGRIWFTAPISQFRNVCMLEALLEQIKEEKGFQLTLADR